MPSSSRDFSSVFAGHFERSSDAFCTFREGDDIAYVLKSEEKRYKSVQAERKSAVRRNAVAERFKKEAEFFGSLLFPMPRTLNICFCISVVWILIEPPPSSVPLSTIS